MEEHNKQSKQTNLNHDPAHLKENVRDSVVKKIQGKVSILITGETGVGKSRLVNALAGTSVAEESRERLRGCTDRLTSYSVVICDIKVIVWDSPGLQDRTVQTVQDEDLYFTDIKQQGFDLMIYCCRMDIKRFKKSDEMAIRALTRVFGKEVWEKTVIALTFANKVEHPDGGNEKAFFESEHNKWKEAINSFLATEVGLDSKVRGAIEIVPAGNYRKVCLPTSENWLSELWTSCFCRMDAPAALALYLLSQPRLAFSGSTALQVESDSSQNQGAVSADASEIPQTIPLNEDQEGTLWRRVSEYLKTSGPDTMKYIAFLGTVGITGLAVLRHLLSPR